LVARFNAEYPEIFLTSQLIASGRISSASDLTPVFTWAMLAQDMVAIPIGESSASAWSLRQISRPQRSAVDPTRSDPAQLHQILLD